MSYPVEGFLEISEDMVQILLMLKVRFTLCGGASSSSEPGLFFSNHLFGLGFKPIQDDFQNGLARVTDEVDGSVD